MNFKDHFSSVATQYASFRPSYPLELYTYLANLAEEKKLAWDCATGNGQAAVELTAHFEKVIATDASKEQLDSALTNPMVDYRVATAENSGLKANSVDLITVAQAVHWFDHEKFNAEVKRVLKPGGIVAIWTYFMHEISPKIDEITWKFYSETLKPFVPEEIQHIENKYQTIPFPYTEKYPVEFTMSHDLDLDELLGYLRTWSAVKAYMATKKQDPVDLIKIDLLEAWPDPSEKKRIKWPLHLRVGQLD